MVKGDGDWEVSPVYQCVSLPLCCDIHHCVCVCVCVQGCAQDYLSDGYFLAKVIENYIKCSILCSDGGAKLA